MKKNSTASSAPYTTLRLAVLLVGPLFSWMLVQGRLAGSLAPGEINFVALTLVVVWSPLFFSIPALLLQRERDRLLPAAGGPVASLSRGLRLTPAMLRDDSGVRTESMASLVGWSALLIATGSNLGAAFSALI